MLTVLLSSNPPTAFKTLQSGLISRCFGSHPNGFFFFFFDKRFKKKLRARKEFPIKRTYIIIFVSLTKIQRPPWKNRQKYNVVPAQYARSLCSRHAICTYFGFRAKRFISNTMCFFITLIFFFATKFTKNV